jgi:hypothetical protein
MFDSSSVAVGQSRSQHKNIIEESRGVELQFGSTHDKHNPSIFNLAVRDRRSPQHLDATSLKVVQVLRIMNATLTIDFVVMDAKSDFMFR